MPDYRWGIFLADACPGRLANPRRSVTRDDARQPPIAGVRVVAGILQGAQGGAGVARAQAACAARAVGGPAVGSTGHAPPRAQQDVRRSAQAHAVGRGAHGCEVGAGRLEVAARRGVEREGPRLLHGGRQLDGRVEGAEGIFLDGQFLGRRTVAALREDKGRALPTLGRIVERAPARQRVGREPRHRISQLLLVGLRLPSDEGREVS